MKKVCELLFGCWHQDYSFPQTRINTETRQKENYVCCLQCGKEFPYDWDEMKVVA